MALKTPYCSVAKADEILAGDAKWTTLSAGVKQDALTKARYWLDSKFTCQINDADPPEEILYANAWLAVDYANAKLYEVAERKQTVKSESVKAGSVSSEVVYSAQSSYIPPSYDLVASVLIGYCVNRGVLSVPLVRA